MVVVLSWPLAKSLVLRLVLSWPLGTWALRTNLISTSKPAVILWAISSKGCSSKAVVRFSFQGGCRSKPVVLELELVLRAVVLELIS